MYTHIYACILKKEIKNGYINEQVFNLIIRNVFRAGILSCITLNNSFYLSELSFPYYEKEK